MFLGIFVVYGAGSFNRQAQGSPLGQHFIVVKHLMVIGLGGMLLLALSHVDYHLWRHPWVNRSALGIAYGLVALTLVMGRHDADGNRLITRWLNIGGFSLQPVELAKIALVMFMAERLAATRGAARLSGRALLTALAAGPLLLVILLVLQPNYGNVMVVAAVTMLMLFITGTADRWLRWLLLGAPVVAVLGYVCIFKVRNRVNELFNGLQGGSFGHQVDQSLIGLGAGGARGLGVG